MKRKLLILLCALLTSVGMWATGYADYLNTANGYNEVTSTSDLADPNYYYVFASAENTSLIVGIADKSDMLPSWYSGTAKILCYKTLSSDPIADATNFFIIANNSGYEMFNVGYNSNTKFQTHDGKAYLWVNTGETNSNDYTKFIPSYDGTNGYWTFQNSKYPDAEHSDGSFYGYLGPWTAGYVAANEHIAGNRTNAENDLAGHFKIYRIKRTRYTKDYAKLNPDVTSSYLTNPGFESDTPISSDASNSKAGNFTDITNWTKVITGNDGNNSYSVTAIASYNSGKKVAGVTVPSAAPTTGSGSNALGVSMAWSGRCVYQQNVTLPAGVYTLSWRFYNASDKTRFTSQLGFIPNSGSSTISSKTSYASGSWGIETVSFTLTAETAGKIQIGGYQGGSSNDNAKIFFDDVTLTYSPLADNDDYTELTSAIETVDGISDFGFDTGEYAPYNVLPILAEAKAIDKSGNNAYTYIRSTIEALNAITSNATEVDAVYNGNFSSDVEGDYGLTGWTRTNAWGQQQTGLSGDYATAYYNQPGSLKYGSNTDYKMPLKANTYYTLKVAYRAHQSDRSTRVTVSVLKSSEGLSDTGLDWTTNTSTWTKKTVIFRTGTAGDYVLTMANYDNTWMTGVSLLRATAAEIKPYLLAEITTANGMYNDGANVGTGVFQIPTAAGTTFNAAIATAQGVYDNGSATADEVTEAIDDLKAAEETFLSTINAPDSEKRYCIVLDNNSEWTYDGKAMTYIANGRNDMGLYTIEYREEPNSNYAQAFILTQVTGNTYKMSQTDVDGNTRYICTGAKYDGGNTSQIRTTTDASKALVVKIIPTSTEGVFNIYNTEASNYIGSQDVGVFTVNSHINFTIQEASLATPNLTIAADVNWATFMSPFAIALNTLEDVEAYTTTSVDGTTVEMTLVEDEIPANTPVLLYRETTEANYKPSLSGWGMATANSYVEGLLTGSYVIGYIPANSYALQKYDGKVGFYKVAAAESIKVGANRAYLTVPVAGAREAFFFEDEETGINTIGEKAASTLQDLLNGADVYDLSGRKVTGALEKNKVYIVNGNKIYVK